MAAAEQIKTVFVSPAVKKYIVDLNRRTRETGDIYLGASPRGSLGLFRASQAWAALQGREYVLPDDVQAMAVSVMGHRIIVSPAARLRDLGADRIVEEIVHSVPVPGGDFQAAANAKKAKS
jgi:MoxR-like ATPase